MELNKDKIVYGVDTDLDEVQNSKFTSLIERPFKNGLITLIKTFNFR